MIVSGQVERVPLLEVVQVLAYSRQSGVLTVQGESTRGAVLFLDGNIVCAHSSSTLGLLVKAAKEQDPESRAKLRRVQSLVALVELLDLKEGLFQFKRTDAQVRDLDGLDLRSFYAAGPMNTGDLLLIAARTAQLKQTEAASPPETAPEHERRHPRCGPTVIEAELSDGSRTFPGYLTNLSLGGAFFHGDELPAEKSAGRLRFTLPGEAKPCEATFGVVWAKTEQGSIRGVGVAFADMPSDDRAKLSAYLERFQRLAQEMRGEE